VQQSVLKTADRDDSAHAWFGVRGNDAMTRILSGL
jgi:hypothetical protein